MIIAVAALTTAACGQAETTEAEPPVADATSPAPPPSEPLNAPDGPTTEPPATIPVNTEPGVFVSEDLRVSVQTAALFGERGRNGDARLSMGLAFTFANQGAEPISVAMTEGGAPTVMLPNGLMISTHRIRWEMSGLMRCEYESSECRVRSPERYVEIAPGETLTVNITLNGSVGAAQYPSLIGLSTANTNMRIHYIKGDSVDRVINVSLPNMPIQNSITS